MTKQSLHTELSDEAKLTQAKVCLTRRGLNPDEILPKLQVKMGDYASDFIIAATTTPGIVAGRTDKPGLQPQPKDLILYYAQNDIPTEQIAKALGAETKMEIDTKVMQIEASANKYRQEKGMTVSQKEEQLPQSAQLLFAQKVDEKTATQTPGPMAPQKKNNSYLDFVQAAPWSKKEEKPAAATETSEPMIETLEGRAYRKAREELEILKAQKGGDLCFDDLAMANVTRTDMKNAVTMDNIIDVQAGTKGQATGRAALNHPGLGRCAKNVNDSIMVGAKISSYDGIEGSVRDRKTGKPSTHNGTTQVRAMRKNKNFYTFDFPSNPQTGNPEIANLKAPGTYIGWEGKDNATQPLGHGAVMGPDGNWHGGILQSVSYMCSTRPAQRYMSDTYTVGFLGDCTVSDELATEMLCQKYIREEKMQGLDIVKMASENTTLGK